MCVLCKHPGRDEGAWYLLMIRATMFEKHENTGNHFAQKRAWLSSTHPFLRDQLLVIQVSQKR